MVNKITWVVLVVSLMVGCHPGASPNTKSNYKQIVKADAAVIIALEAAAPSAIVPHTPVSDVCPNCDGVGKVGDGRTMVTCPVCKGTGKKPSKATESSNIELPPPLEEDIGNSSLGEIAEPAVKQDTSHNVSKHLIGPAAPAACPLPEPIDYDKIFAEVEKKVSEAVSAKKPFMEVEAAAMNDTQEQITKLVDKYIELAEKITSLEKKLADMTVAVKPEPATKPLPPTTDSYGVVTAYLIYDSADMHKFRNTIASKLPQGWKYSEVYTNQPTKLQVLENRQIRTFQGIPALTDIVTSK